MITTLEIITIVYLLGMLLTFFAWGIEDKNIVELAVTIFIWPYRVYKRLLKK